MSTRMRAPVVVATPSPSARSRHRKTTKIGAEQKAGLLENFDLELVERTAEFRKHLEASLTSFQLRQQSELMRIPRELRQMTLAEVEKHWGGSFRGTVKRMTAERKEAEERERERVEAEERRQQEEEEKQREEASKGKRKRGTNTASPERSSKTARKANTPMKGNTPLRGRAGVPGSTSKRRIGQKNASTPQKSQGHSDHVFNPAIPTPLRKLNPNDILLSKNGSPIFNPFANPKLVSQAVSTGSPLASAQSRSKTIVEPAPQESDANESGEDDEEDVGDDLELPDEAAMMAAAEKKALQRSQQGSHPSSRNIPGSAAGPDRPSKPRRKSSIIWGHDASYQPLAGSSQANRREPTKAPALEPGYVRVYIRGVTKNNYFDFNPLQESKAALEEELSQCGADGAERERMRLEVKKLAIKALREREEMWDSPSR